MPNRKKITVILISILSITVAVIGFTFLAYNHIKNKSEKYIYNSVNEIPKNKIGLLLGTSKYAVTGQVNLFYKYRIDAAVKLFTNKKIKYILVSGDNSTKKYNEPKKIKEDLIKLGIPEQCIVLDYAGFRTLDSVVRANEVFGENTFTIISQNFHNERAVYLARKFNSNAIAFNAQSVNQEYGFKVYVREYLARVKVFVDLLFKVEPKFLGEKISIPSNEK